MRKMCFRCKSFFAGIWKGSCVCPACEDLERSEEQQRKNAKRESYLRAVAQKVGESIDYLREKLEAQGGLCFICRKPPPDKRHLALDHDHETDQIRGYLCWNCNLGLGHFKDNEELLQRAIEYLRAFRKDAECFK